MSQTPWVMDDQHGSPVRLEFDFVISPSGGALTAVLAEDSQVGYAVVAGYSPSLDAMDRREAVALVSVRHVVQAVFGYPNEEAYWKDPRGRLDHGFYEIVGGTWIDRINDYNRRSFGTDYHWHPDFTPRHFFVGSKDRSVQFLGENLSLEIFPDRPFRDVYQDACSRLQ